MDPLAPEIPTTIRKRQPPHGFNSSVFENTRLPYGVIAATSPIRLEAATAARRHVTLVAGPDLMTRSKLLLAVALCVAAGPARAQPPASACDFDGFDVKAELAEVTKPAVAYYACSAARKCLSMPLKPGDVAVISHSEGDWTCAYLISRKGSAQGWVQAGALRPVEADPNPPLTAWLGTWVQDENRIRIERSKTNGKLSLDGEAYWRGGRDNVHEGAIAGEVTPQGNRAHYEEGSAESCNIDLALIGSYLLASDNSKCGGMNVHFWGVWRRLSTPRR